MCVVCVLPAVSVSLLVRLPMVCFRLLFLAFLFAPVLLCTLLFVFGLCIYLFIYFLHFLDFGSYVLWISALVFRICPPVSCVSVHPDKSVFDISFLSVNRKCHTKLLLHPFLANLDICYRNGLALCHSFHWRQYLSKHQFDDCKF